MKKSGKVLQFIDIGANLVDTMFSGVYNGSKKHEPDFMNVLNRCWDSGIQKLLITGTNLEDSKSAIEISKNNEKLFCTVGCHPTNCNDFEKSGDPNSYLQSLVQLAKNNQERVKAIGEFGLDYDRIHFCPKETQLKYFEEQLVAFEELKLPLFLHCRNSSEDLLNVLKRNRDTFGSGVVHSFDGNETEAKNILELGLYIGINGCSLKTEENLKVVKTIPSDRLLLETDSPWCEIRPSHAGAKYIKTTYPSVKKEKWEAGKLVKGRNEPCNIIQVLEIIAAVREENIEDLSDTIYQNSEKLFFSNEK